MLLQPGPVVLCVERILRERGPGRVFLTTPQGRRFTQTLAASSRPRSTSCSSADATKASTKRIARSCAPRELSIGDYVLTGGELAAMVVTDAVVRLLRERSATRARPPRSRSRPRRRSRVPVHAPAAVPRARLCRRFSSQATTRGSRGGGRRKSRKKTDNQRGGEAGPDNGQGKSAMRKLSEVEKQYLRKQPTNFDVGDNVNVGVVHHRDGREEGQARGEGARAASSRARVIGRRGTGVNEFFTVRRIVAGEGVERVFPLNSPKVAHVEVTASARVRRAKALLPARSLPASPPVCASASRVPSRKSQRPRKAACLDLITSRAAPPRRPLRRRSGVRAIACSPAIAARRTGRSTSSPSAVARSRSSR